MKRPKAKSGENVVRSVILPRDVDRRLLALAEEEERPLSYLIARAVKEFLERRANNPK